MIELTDVERDVACPFCRATAGEPCVDDRAGGLPTATPHRSRVTDWSLEYGDDPMDEMSPWDFHGD